MKDTNRDARKKDAYEAERKAKKIAAIAEAYGAKVGREANSHALRSIQKELNLAGRYGRPVQSIIIDLKEIKSEDVERLKAEFNKSSPMMDFNRDARPWLGDYTNGGERLPLPDPLMLLALVVVGLQIAFVFLILILALWK